MTGTTGEAGATRPAAVSPRRRRRRSRAERWRAAVERIGIAVTWIVVVALVGLGAASAVSGLDHQPGTPARAELTWAGDSVVAPALEGAIDELESLLADLDALGVRGRGALAAMTAREFDELDTAVAEGGALVTGVRERAASLRGRLTSLPGFGPGEELRLSDDTRQLHERLLAALDATDDLDASWARLTAGGVTAAQVAGFLDEHDAHVLSAIDAGSAGSYPTALRRLGAATAALDEVDRLRVQLENTADVTTLVEWLSRNRAYDEALRTLYEALAASPDRVTPEIRDAVLGERRARDRLPETDRPISIVMADIARGGINQAVIAIEEARGEIALALERLRPPNEPG